MGGFFENLDYSVLINPLMRLIPLLICITIHELAHGYMAYRLGDPTAKMMGRLTLNPIKHIDPAGALMILIVGFGWAKPVPVDMRNFRNPKRDMAVTALAGPMSNIILALFVLIILALVSEPLTARHSLYHGEFFLNSLTGVIPNSSNEFVYQIIARTAWLSILLAIFNLIPIPPLDGSKILFSFLPDRLHESLMRNERFGFLILMALMILPSYVDAMPDILGPTILRLALFMISTTAYLFGIIPNIVHMHLTGI